MQDDDDDGDDEDGGEDDEPSVDIKEVIKDMDQFSEEAN